MNRLVIFALLWTVALPAYSDVEPGSHIVFEARLLNCDMTSYVVDYAQVSDSGHIDVFDGIEISVIGLDENEIARRVAESIGKQTGRTPKTLTVRLVAKAELEHVAAALLNLTMSGPDCERPGTEDPPPDMNYIRSLANCMSQCKAERPPIPRIEHGP